ncbi:MAG TPA: NADP-dependent glyceraldehyde-3-phosphate dehydrogenase [Chloroflexota bacterium]|nr:NADP-dependent glyceraldehyde-3-phosphate dehydrogenase [Chloroflexota bacterium]
MALALVPSATPLFEALRDTACASSGPFVLRNGQWRAHDPARAITITAPADGAPLGVVPALARQEIDALMEHAALAQPPWAARPVGERAAWLDRAADLLEDHADTLAALLSREIAKNRKDSREEVLRSADFIRFTAEEGKRLHGETLLGDSFPGYSRSKVGLTMRVPLGIVLAIPPFNYPINLAVSKIAPALVAGNAVVLKPPTQGALSALHLAALFLDAGIPDGVLQVATGRGSEIGDYLVEHPRVNMISFTGSTETGQRLAKKAGMVPLMLELGGKDAAIVLGDADLDETVKNIVSGAFSYSGQRCTAVKRVLVTPPLADALVGTLTSAVRALSVGQPEDDPVVTPLISVAAADYVQELIDDAVKKGAVVLTGNRREGSLVWPTLVDGVTAEMRLAWEEPFGPVLPIMRVRDAAEAVTLVNSSEYGLQTSIFTRDVDVALRVAEQLEVGTVQINGKTARGPDHFPFLGTKSSGMGTQGVRYSLEAMTRLKAVVFNVRDRTSLEMVQ